MSKAEFDIPESAVIHCPISNKLRRVAACEKCDHLAGIIEHQINSNDPIPFSQKHSIACKFPRQVPISELEEEG